MADIQETDQFTITAINRFIVGNVAQYMGTMTIQIDNDNSLAGAAIEVQARARQTTLTFVPIPYVKLYLNGTVADGTAVSTSITTSSLIQIPVCDGLEIALNVTTATAVTGSASVRAWASNL